MQILIATGDSLDIEMALQFGAQLAKKAGEPPTVLTVIRRKTDRSRADSIFVRAAELLKNVAPNFHTKIRVGNTTEEIIREAEEGGYDLCIVGDKRGPNLLRRFQLGSPSVRVVERAPCPVIIVKGKIGTIRRILLCDSGAESPSPLSQFTAQLVKLIEGEEQVTVLHVMSQISAGPGVEGKELNADAEDLIQENTPEGLLLKQNLQILDQPHVHSRPKVRHGFVVDEIIEETITGDHDLVVIGAYRAEGWQSFLLNDLAHQIIVKIDRPVLVVR